MYHWKKKKNNNTENKQQQISLSKLLISFIRVFILNTYFNSK